MRLAVICLAAGYSRRFPENKLLYPLSGKPLFAWGLEALETFARRCGGTVYTVTQYPQIIRYCEKKGLPYALNCPDTNTGKASSIKMGLETAKDCWDCYLFQVADQPWIDLIFWSVSGMEYQSSGKGIGCVCDRMGRNKKSGDFFPVLTEICCWNFRGMREAEKSWNSFQKTSGNFR